MRMLRMGKYKGHYYDVPDMSYCMTLESVTVGEQLIGGGHEYGPKVVTLIDPFVQLYGLGYIYLVNYVVHICTCHMISHDMKYRIIR